MIFLNGQLTCRLSGPSYPPLVQWHPYPLVPHDLSQPSIPTLQSHMLSFSPASLPSSPSCPPQPQHPKPPVLHAFLQPYIPVVWSLVTYLSPTSLPSSLTCYPSAQHPYLPPPHALSTIPASLTSSPSCLSSGIHPCCPVTHAHPQPSIPTLQSLMKCPPSAPASLPSSPLQPTSTLHSLSSASLPSGPYCPSSALHVQFKTPINKK